MSDNEMTHAIGRRLDEMFGRAPMTPAKPPPAERKPPDLPDRALTQSHAGRAPLITSED